MVSLPVRQKEVILPWSMLRVNHYFWGFAALLANSTLLQACIIHTLRAVEYQHTCMCMPYVCTCVHAAGRTARLAPDRLMGAMAFVRLI
jgi:hypothetical protein